MIGPLLNMLGKTIESAAADKEDILGVDLDKLLLRCLRPP